MITKDSKKRLLQVYHHVCGESVPNLTELADDQILLGSLETAFHIGQSQAVKEAMDAIVDLGRAKNSNPSDSLWGNWASGYLDAQNDLLEIFGAKFDDLKANIATANSLTELTTPAGPDVDD